MKPYRLHLIFEWSLQSSIGQCSSKKKAMKICKNYVCSLSHLVLLLIFCSGQNTAAAQNTAKVMGTIIGLPNVDSAKLGIYIYGPDQSCVSSEKRIVRINDGVINFEIPISNQKKPVIITLGAPASRAVLLKNGYGANATGDDFDFISHIPIFSGDEFKFIWNPEGFIFKGKDSAYFSLLYKISKTIIHFSPAWRYSDPERYFEMMDTILEKKLIWIANEHKKIDAVKALYLEATARIINYWDKVSFVREVAPPGPYQHGGSADFFENALKNNRKKTWKNIVALDRMDMAGQLTNSPWFIFYQFEKYKDKRGIYDGRKIPVIELAKYFRDSAKGYSRDQALAYLLAKKATSGNGEEDVQQLIEIANANIRTPEFLIVAQRIKERFGIGAKLAPFKFVKENGEIVTNDSFKDKVVLIDLWWTGCGACRQIRQTMDSVKRLFKDQPFEILSVSSDIDKRSWLNSLKSGLYTSDLNINVRTEGKGLRDPFFEYYQTISAPSFYLVSKRGILLPRPIVPLTDKGLDLVKKINQALTSD